MFTFVEFGLNLQTTRCQVETNTSPDIQFEENGFLGPVEILGAQQCKDLSNALREPGKAVAWPKGRAPESRLLFELGTNSVILDTLEELLGPNVALFAASIVDRAPGQIHPWHTDMETAHTGGQAISVWIGLENTNTNSSLQVLTRSHKLGKTIQEVASDEQVARENVSVDDVVGWAQQIDSNCKFVNVEMTNGMAVFFDGRLWHGSDNKNMKGTRRAVLLQYVAPDCPVRIPDPANTEWPFSYYQIPKPPCIMVRGSANSNANEYVPPPDRGDASRTTITQWVQQLDLPLGRDTTQGKRSHGIFSGRTRVVDDMSCHVSVLEASHTPHPPHEHAEEEILIMLDGEADLVSVQEEDGAEVKRRVKRGDFAYYPGGFRHTIKNSSESPATYLMFKWFGRGAVAETDMDAQFVTTSDFFSESIAAAGRGESESDLKIVNVIDGSTSFLRKLHCHTSTLDPGGGYDKHIDAHDVAIVVLEGAVTVMGEEVRDNGVIYFSAGEPHDMQNAGTVPARYVVFEFHPEGRLTDMGWRYSAEQTLRSVKRIAKRMGARKVVDALRSIRR